MYDLSSTRTQVTYLHNFKQKIPMIASDEPQQNLSDYNQFLFKKRFDNKKNIFFLVKNWEIQVIVSHSFFGEL